MKVRWPNIAKRMLLCMFLIWLSLSGIAQQKNVEFSKQNFSDTKGLKAALREIDEGDRYYNLVERVHFLAIENYLKAHQFNPHNAELNKKIGHCYLNSNQKYLALDYLERAKALDPAVDPHLLYYLGQASQLLMKWDQAVAYYEEYKKLPAAKDSDHNTRTEKFIAECKTGKEITRDSIKATITNLAMLNTEHVEYGPVITADESVVIFTARLPSSTGGLIERGSGLHFEDIYQANRSGDGFLPPTALPDPVNTYGHDAAIGLSLDGQKLFIYVDDNGDGNIYVCQLKGTKWSKPHKLDKTINSAEHESSASFSPDEKTIYFVSSRKEGGMGGRDIYYSTLDENGKWGKALNMGSGINTSYNEEAVFMHPNGKTIFFSSQGHNTMGGYDIFMSTFDESTRAWSKPQNLGYPVNTPGDDLFFVLSADGKNAYCSSIRPEGKGEKDLYRITFHENLIKEAVTLFKGTVSGADGKFLEATLTVKDRTTGEVVGSFASNSSTGKFMISLPAGKSYDVEVAAPGFLAQTEKIDIPLKADYREIVRDIVLKSNNAAISGRIVDGDHQPLAGFIEVTDKSTNELIGKFTSDIDGKFRLSVPVGREYTAVFSKPGYLFQTVNLSIPDSIGWSKDIGDVVLQKVDVGKKMVLNNIFFDFNKATIKPESVSELDRAAKLLTDMASLEVEISGHTDNVGSASYNQKLSESRAKSVMDYLVSKGIEKKRLVHKGYGLTQPVASNDTEEGRQLNRRTEFKVLKVNLEAEQQAEAKRMQESGGSQSIENQTNAGQGQSQVPEKFNTCDSNSDGKISSEEVMAVIDRFFDGNSAFTAPDILSLVDYFFDQ